MATNIESSGSPVNNYHRRKVGLQLVTMCVVLAAMIFGLIHAVTYFTNSTGAGTAHTWRPHGQAIKRFFSIPSLDHAHAALFLQVWRPARAAVPSGGSGVRQLVMQRVRG